MKQDKKLIIMVSAIIGLMIGTIMGYDRLNSNSKLCACGNHLAFTRPLNWESMYKNEEEIEKARAKYDMTQEEFKQFRKENPFAIITN